MYVARMKQWCIKMLIYINNPHIQNRKQMIKIYIKYLQNQIWRVHRENINNIIWLSCIIHSGIMSQYDNLDALCDNHHDDRKHMSQSRLTVQTYVCMRKMVAFQYNIVRRSFLSNRKKQVLLEVTQSQHYKALYYSTSFI